MTNLFPLLAGEGQAEVMAFRSVGLYARRCSYSIYRAVKKPNELGNYTPLSGEGQGEVKRKSGGDPAKAGFRLDQLSLPLRKTH
jgi:hypothetical protein